MTYFGHHFVRRLITASSMLSRFFCLPATALFILLLNACGGGGSESKLLYADVYYPSTLQLFHPGPVSPTFTGFEGHGPQCSLANGSPPTGMTLGGDCRLNGVPLASGRFSFTVNVGASGVSGTISQFVRMSVDGPRVWYGTGGSEHGMTVGDTLSIVPGAGNWSTPSQYTPTWKFVLTGSLPPGLTINESTGEISGLVTAAGQFRANVQPTLITPYGSYTADLQSYNVSVTAPRMWYHLSTTGDRGVRSAYISEPFYATPSFEKNVTLGGFSLSGPALSPGLAFDPLTGVISGTPTALNIMRDAPPPYVVSATVTAFDVAYTITADIPSQVDAPFSFRYPSKVSSAPLLPYYPLNTMWMPVGTALNAPPELVRSTGVLGTPSQRFSLSNCVLPEGLTLSPDTGVISGIPSVKTQKTCRIVNTFTNNGLSWLGFADLLFVIE